MILLAVLWGSIDHPEFVGPKQLAAKAHVNFGSCKGQQEWQSAILRFLVLMLSLIGYRTQERKRVYALFNVFGRFVHEL